MDYIYGLNRWARLPDLTILLNVSPHQCYARMRNRPQDRELFEKNLAERAEKYQQGTQLLREMGTDYRGNRCQSGRRRSIQRRFERA